MPGSETGGGREALGTVLPVEDPELYVIPEGTYPGVHLIEEIHHEGPLPWPRVLGAVFGFWPWFVVTYKLWFTALLALNIIGGYILCAGGEAHLFWSSIIAALIFPALLIGAMTIPLNIHRAVTRKQR